MFVISIFYNDEERTKQLQQLTSSYVNHVYMTGFTLNFGKVYGYEANDNYIYLHTIHNSQVLYCPWLGSPQKWWLACAGGVSGRSNFKQKLRARMLVKQKANLWSSNLKLLSRHMKDHYIGCQQNQQQSQQQSQQQPVPENVEVIFVRVDKRYPCLDFIDNVLLKLCETIKKYGQS